jgi:hypothetical protein
MTAAAERGAHAAQRAETYLRLQAEAALRRAVGYQPFPADSCLWRVAEQASALADAGAIDDALAESVVKDLRLALLARGLIEDIWPGAELRSYMRRRFAGLPVPRAVRMVPVGVEAVCDFQNQPVRVLLGTLSLAPDSAGVTVIATASPPHPPLTGAFGHCAATDDRGNSYQLHLTGGGGDSRHEGVLHFDSVPPESVRWLDVTLPGADPIRVDIKSAPAPLLGTEVTVLADTAAERYLDALAIRMLWRACGGEAAVDEPDAAAAVCALLGAGVLAAGSMALGRLAATASLLGIDLALASVPPVSVPGRWLGMLRRQGALDGPTAVARLAGAVLPVLDGVRCVITEIASRADLAMVRVQAWSCRPPDSGRIQPGPVCWTADDDLGGFYAASLRGGGSSNEYADLVLELRPGIDPRASELRVMLTGRTSEVSVTVPLVWQEEEG